jgi:hypothetical protein
MRIDGMTVARRCVTIEELKRTHDPDAPIPARRGAITMIDGGHAHV